MDISERKRYGGDEAPDGNGAAPCPNCGCRHMEAVKIAANKDSITFRVTCRYCGWQTRRTVGIEIAKPSDASARLDERGDDDD